MTIRASFVRLPAGSRRDHPFVSSSTLNMWRIGTAAVYPGASIAKPVRPPGADPSASPSILHTVMTRRYPIAVLVSGSGTNLQAILDAAEEPTYTAEVVVVIADRPGIEALDRAQAAGLSTEVVPWDDYVDRHAFTAACCDAAARHGGEALVLAGFMRILSPVAMERFPQRILNTHPALLPAFPGAHAVPQALAHGVKLTGVTIHFVDEEVDHGPIIFQEAVAVEAGDTEELLQRRIQAVEHRRYPEVVDAFAAGRLSVAGRVVTWSGARS